MELLKIKNLTVAFKLLNGELNALKDFSLKINAKERVGIVGESGAGKSVLAFSVLNLLQPPGFIKSGNIFWNRRDLTELSERQLRPIRGGEIAMIFQDPMVSLNPLLTIGEQLVETVLAHSTLSKKEAKQRALEVLAEVKIPSPKLRMEQYPHEFSGGMRQRIIIASALITSPKLIIADEPTTALDVTIQAEILALLETLSEKKQMALLLITHDLGVVSRLAQRVVVMYAGRKVEENHTKKILSRPRHPYTAGLINCLPQAPLNTTKRKTGRRPLRQIPGQMPPLDRIPEGCAFHPRCENKKALCSKQLPTYKEDGEGGYFCFAPRHYS